MTSMEKYESIMNKLEDRRIEEVALSRLATLDENTMISHSDMVAHFEVTANGLLD
jgi:hypothetical protein